MCLIINGKPNVKIAEQDLPIYKLVRDLEDYRMETLYQFCEVFFNERYKADMQWRNGNWGALCDIDADIVTSYENPVSVEEGLHAFWGEIDKELFEEYINNIYPNRFGHSNYLLLNGYIPSGAEYILNEQIGLVVSSEMVYTSLERRL
jgi:hypothetical protein